MKKIMGILVTMAIILGLVGCDLFEVEIKVKFNEQKKSIHATTGTSETAYKIDNVSSSDSSVVEASISGDVVTLTSKGKGTATVTFYSEEDAKIADCSVSVSETGDITDNTYRLSYRTYSSSSNRLWRDNPKSITPVITEGWYSKNTDSTYKLRIEGNIIYALHGDYWVRGIARQGSSQGYFTKIDWKTKGTWSGSTLDPNFDVEVSYSSGYDVPTELKNSSIYYTINGSALTLGGTAYTKN